MSDSERPIIIKRKKVSGGDGHHGGAWKVAYADFVTAMMAFFMLMWLLNATTEKQRKGLADYFSPTIPIMRISGGGDGALQGDSMFAENVLVQNGLGATARTSTMGDGALGMTGEAHAKQAAAEHAAENKRFDEVIEGLMGKGGDSLREELALEHVQTRLTDEGLVIEIFALEDRPLFDGVMPTPVTELLSEMIVEATNLVTNSIAIEGYLRTAPIVVVDSRTWEQSSERAHAMRTLLVSKGLTEPRVKRITGHGDRQKTTSSPVDIRNNRIEVILLRSDR